MSEHVIQNSHGSRLVVCERGASVRCLDLPDRWGDMADVVLGLETEEDYRENPCFLGAAVGPLAGRTFPADVTIGDETFALTQNEGETHLHGGHRGFDQRCFLARVMSSGDGPSIELTTQLEHGEDGYPGNRTVKIVYTLTDDHIFRVEASMETDAPTFFDPTHHSYFNLAGHDAGTLAEHRLMIPAQEYIPVDDRFLLVDNAESVEGTWLDFREAARLGDRLKPGSRGLCYPYVLKEKDSEEMVVAAVLSHPNTGRRLTVITNQNVINVYSADYLIHASGVKGGAHYGRQGAICLETQNYASGMHVPNRPSSIIYPGTPQVSRTDYKFDVDA